MVRGGCVDRFPVQPPDRVHVIEPRNINPLSLTDRIGGVDLQLIQVVIHPGPGASAQSVSAIGFTLRKKIH